jgi:hypothetical protein
MPEATEGFLVCGFTSIDSGNHRGGAPGAVQFEPPHQPARKDEVLPSIRKIRFCYRAPLAVPR